MCLTLIEVYHLTILLSIFKKGVFLIKCDAPYKTASFICDKTQSVFDKEVVVIRYSKCVTCPSLGNKCPGPPLLLLEPEETWEIAKAIKDYLGYTNAYIEKIGKAPIGTINRFFTTFHTDFRVDTVRKIFRPLLGVSDGEIPFFCPLEYDELHPKIEELEKKNAALHRVIKENKAAYDADLERERTDADKKIAYLKNQLRVRMIFIIALAAVLFVSLVVIFAALIIDRTDPSRGFFWFGKEAQAVIEQIFGYIFQHASRVISIGLK